MKLINTTRRSLLLGIALLGATTFVGFATPALAQTRDDQNTPQSSDTHDKHHDTDTAHHDAPNHNARHAPQHHEGRGPGQASSSQGRPDFRLHTGRSESEGGGYPSHSSHQDPTRPDFQDRSKATKEGEWHHGGGDQDRNRPDHYSFDQHNRDHSDNSGNHSNAQLRPGHDRTDRPDQEREDYRNRPDHRGQGYSGDQGRFNNRPGDRERFDDRELNRERSGGIGNLKRKNRGGGNSYTGTVTRVRSDQSFDVNIAGNSFNVYTNSRTPSGLSKGDTVRVNGMQQGANDIRDARVSIVRDR